MQSLSWSAAGMVLFSAIVVAGCSPSSPGGTGKDAEAPRSEGGKDAAKKDTGSEEKDGAPKNDAGAGGKDAARKSDTGTVKDGDHDGNTTLGTYLGSCDLDCNKAYTCDDYYTGAPPAVQSYSEIETACNSQGGGPPPTCDPWGGGGPPAPRSSPCPTAARVGSCTILYLEEVIRFYPPATTADAQKECTEIGAVYPGGSTFVP
jgi:hypothetical protein